MKISRTARGVVWNTLGSLIYGAHSFIMLTMVSRFGTIEQVGEFSIALTTVQLLYFLAVFGAHHYQMTDYTGKNSFSVYVVLRVLCCILMICVGAVSFLLLQFHGETLRMAIWLLLLMVANAVAELYQCLFFSKNRLDLSGKCTFFRTFFSIVAYCTAAAVTGNIILALAVQVVANVSALVYYALRYTREFVPKKESFAFSQVMQLAYRCFPLFCGLLIANLLLSCSKYAIEFFCDSTAQGYYNLVFIPVQVINLCSQFLFKPMLGQYGELIAKGNSHQATRLLKLHMAMITGLTVVACAGAMILGVPVLSAIYSVDISAYRMSLVGMTLGGGFFAAVQMLYYILVITRRERQVFMMYLGGMALSVVITPLLVKLYAVPGAVAALIISYAVLSLVFFMSALRALGEKEKAI